MRQSYYVYNRRPIEIMGNNLQIGLFGGLLARVATQLKFQLESPPPA